MANLPDIYIMSAENPCTQPGQFLWNELVTTDESAAAAFYTALFGWKTEAFNPGQPSVVPYTLFKQGDAMRGGMMKCPHPGLPAHWLAYVSVPDVDAAAAEAAKLGGQVVVPPMDIPTVGRIAVLVDPQGAAIGIFKPLAM